MNYLKSTAFVHWRTSLAGVAIGALNLYAQGATPKAIALSVALAVLGLVASDGQPTAKPDGAPTIRVSG